MNVTLDAARAEAIAQALAAIPDGVYDAIDRGEPEWRVLEIVSMFPIPINVLTVLALALSDFQLGSGGTTRYWNEVEQEIATQGRIEDPVHLRRFMRAVMSRPVAARLKTMKLARVEKLLNSDVPQWLADRTIEQVGAGCMELWFRLSGAMQQPPHAKTVALAMKLVDLLHKIATGSYIPFPARVPIVADLRIGRVSLSSGLLATGGESVPRAMTRIGGLLSSAGETVLSAWASVSERAHGTSLFRIDSLVWQVAEPIYEQRHNRQRAADRTADILRKYYSESRVAPRVAAELTYALPPR